MPGVGRGQTKTWGWTNQRCGRRAFAAAAVDGGKKRGCQPAGGAAGWLTAAAAGVARLVFSEFASLNMEFEYLSRISGDPVFATKA